jgi:hypothetical protein
LGFLAYFTLIFHDVYKKTKDKKFSLLCVAASFIQLSAYGIGFILELFNYVIKRR